MPRQSRIDAPVALHHIIAGFRDGRVAELLDLKPEQVLAVGKYKKTVAARSFALFLKISQPAVGLTVKRLRAIGYTPQLLVKSLNSNL